MNFSSQIFFNDINHRYRAAITKKNSLWLLPFYMAVGTYFYYKKVRRTMRNAVVLYLTYFERYLRTTSFENLSGAAILIFRRYFGSSSPEAFYKKSVLKTSVKFLGKHIRLSLFSIKLQIFKFY